MLYYNKLLLHKIDKIKMAGTSREISSVMTSAANNQCDNARRTDRASASISCEHCRSSRNSPHCAPRHAIYYNLQNIFLIIRET